MRGRNAQRVTARVPSYAFGTQLAYEDCQANSPSQTGSARKFLAEGKSARKIDWMGWEEAITRPKFSAENPDFVNRILTFTEF
jgi:hypothetical protein